MNDWERLHRQAERYKQSYPPGTRVMLLNMNDPYSPVESGMRGTVQSVDDIGQLLMKWDNGKLVRLLCKALHNNHYDKFHKMHSFP